MNRLKFSFDATTDDPRYVSFLLGSLINCNLLRPPTVNCSLPALTKGGFEVATHRDSPFLPQSQDKVNPPPPPHTPFFFYADRPSYPPPPPDPRPSTVPILISPLTPPRIQLSVQVPRPPWTQKEHSRCVDLIGLRRHNKEPWSIFFLFY
jgi:hypothetical protein